jgi:hypothetical protein
METDLADDVSLPELSRRKKKKKSFIFEVTEWKFSYTSSTTKEVGAQGSVVG